ncbi:MAG TPA: DUF4190 domain-containing protein [Flavobacteriales bacterium]|nr:DUF4190 domain-containing protein [Flavobacteriales bacterium]
MRHPARALLPCLALATMGCAGTAHQAHGPQYGWLRKQGHRATARQAVPDAPALRTSGGAAAGEPALPMVREEWDGADMAAMAALPGGTIAPARSPSGDDPQALNTARQEPARPSPSVPFSVSAGQPFSTMRPDPGPAIAPAAHDQDDHVEAERRWNIKGLVAAPIGVGTVIAGLALHSVPLLLIGGAVAFALGLWASRQCRDRMDRGKGFALVGMILGAAALFFSLMVLVLGVG